MKDCIWITEKTAGTCDLQVYYFKKSFNLSKLDSATVDISAQARYKLYINGTLLGVGPCKGTREKLFYDRIDVTGALKKGKNEIFVEVLQLPSTDVDGKPCPIEGVMRFGACMLAFELTCGDFVLKADESWRVSKIKGITHTYAPSTYSGSTREIVDATKVLGARYTGAARHTGVSNGEDDHYWWGITNRAFLFERPIPMLSFTDKTDIIKRDGEYFEADYLTFGFPTFKISGKGTVKLRYFEAFGSHDEKNNGDRCDKSRPFYDKMADEITVDGEYVFTPFWFRTFRFINIDTEGDVSVEMTSFCEVNYPMVPRTDYDFGREDDNALWKISVRTLQRCMHESYEDCPFYEQLQYAMDTSCQMLFNYQLTDDDLLARKAMDDFAAAQEANGLMPSRYPSLSAQHIPSFQFYFIFMVYAHYIRFGDLSLVRKHIRAIDGVIEWFRGHIDENGVVGQSKYWNFFDWAKPWVYDQKRGCEGGVPLGVYEGVIGIYNPMMAYFLQCAAKLNTLLGRNDVAEEYLSLADSLKENTLKYFWDEEKGLFADDVNHIYYSQHMQTWCVLCGVATGALAKKIMTNSLDLEAKATYAFAYFYFRALEAAGLYEKTELLMDSYRSLLKLNCSTVPETPTNTRSECHAWGAIAIYEFSATVLGVRTENVLEKSVSVKPYIENRDSAKGTVSTIGGNVSVSWKKENGVFMLSVRKDNPETKLVITMPNGTAYECYDNQKSFICKI